MRSGRELPRASPCLRGVLAQGGGPEVGLRDRGLRDARSAPQELGGRVVGALVVFEADVVAACGQGDRGAPVVRRTVVAPVHDDGSAVDEQALAVVGPYGEG